tara:strand:- start:580 stop:765 length:186 start_codon:yes stop_codon:yes gene_type:complete
LTFNFIQSIYYAINDFKENQEQKERERKRIELEIQRKGKYGEQERIKRLIDFKMGKPSRPS